MVLLNLTENEYAYVIDVVVGCCWDSYQEDEGTASLSRAELLRLLKKLGAEEIESQDAQELNEHFGVTEEAN